MEADAIPAAAPHQVIHDLRLHLSPVCGRSREPRFSAPSATVRCNLPVSQMRSIVATTYSMSSFSMTPFSALDHHVLGGPHDKLPFTFGTSEGLFSPEAGAFRAMVRLAGRLSLVSAGVNTP